MLQRYRQKQRRHTIKNNGALLHADAAQLSLNLRSAAAGDRESSVILHFSLQLPIHEKVKGKQGGKKKHLYLDISTSHCPLLTYFHLVMWISQNLQALGTFCDTSALLLCTCALSQLHNTEQ